jgi:hypothetical protein
MKATKENYPPFCRRENKRTECVRSLIWIKSECGRLAHKDEYKVAVGSMISYASSYLNGAIVNIDGGRTTW